MKKIKAYVVNHGHMDIEWYQPLTTFSEWFAKSLEMLRRIAKDDPDYPCFTFDGAVFPVEYVSEHFPELKETVAELLSSQTLKIGPFYTQFDEFLISGETMIQNLLWGDRACRHLQTKPMKAGYLPDNFGHPAQLPQILNHFGIQSLFFSRGMCDIGDNAKEFLFCSPDGSQVVAQNFSYGSTFRIYENNSPRPSTPNLLPYYRDIYCTYDYLSDLSKHVDHQGIARQLIEGVKGAVGFYPSGIVPLFVGADHCPPQEGLPKTLAVANAMQEEIEFIFSDAEELSRVLNEDKSRFVAYSGDLLGCKFDRLLFGANTTRSYLKRRMFDCEHLLFCYALPLSSYANYFGAKAHQSELKEATKLLLLNSTHDSIHGSSLDCVHRENEARFDRAAQLCARSIHSCLDSLSRQLQSREGQEEFLVYSPVEFDGYVNAWLLTENQEIEITDAEGACYPSSPLPQAPVCTNAKGEPYYQRPTGESVREIVFRARFKAGEVKKFFYTLKNTAMAEPPSRTSHKIENEFFLLEVQNNTLSLWDRTTGQEIPAFLHFTEEAETGDTFDHSFPFGESPSFDSCDFPYTELTSFQCEAYQQLCATCTLRVPLETVGDLRSSSLVDLPIRLTFTLWKGIRRLDLKAVIQNYAKNHRVRAEFCFPESFAEVQAGELFCTEQFSVERPPKGEFWKEEPCKEFPMRNWVSVKTNNLGYTLCTKGLYTFEPLDHKRLAFTLFRSVGELMRIHIQSRSSCCMTGIPVEDAQCLREMEFEFSLFTHAPKISPYEIERLTEEVLCPPAVHPLRKNQGQSCDPASFVPYRFLENSSFAVSAFQPSYDGNFTVLRFFEINGKSATARIDLSRFQRVFLSDLNEAVHHELPLSDGILELEVCPNKIITLLLQGFKDETRKALPQ